MENCIKWKRYVTAVVAVLAVSLCCGGCGTGTEETDTAVRITEEQTEKGEESPFLIKIATNKLPESNAYEILSQMKETIEEKSEGSLEVQLYPGDQLGDQATIMEGLHIGTVELAYLPVVAAENIYPDIEGLESVYTSEDEVSALETYQSDEAQKMLEEFCSQKRVRSIGISMEGARSLWVKNRVEEIGDISGLVIGMADNPSAESIFRDLGAATSFMPASQIYDRLRAGLLDGAEWDAESVLCYNLYEQCKYCLQTNHVYTVYTFFASDDVFQKMTEEQQTIVQEAAEAACLARTEQYIGQKEEIQQELEEKGVAFISEDEKIIQQIRNAVTNP